MTNTAAVIGLGKIGMLYDKHLASSEFVLSHARSLHLHCDFQLVGAVDPDPVLRGDFVRLYEAPAYENLSQMMAQVLPDVVVVASPTPTHEGVLNQVLTQYAPKAVLCEKPLAYEGAAGQRMVEACARARVPIYVNYIRRADPGVQEVKGRISSGRIAPPFKAVVWYSKGLLHNGSHFADLLCYWFGPIRLAQVIDPGRGFGGNDAEPDFRLVFDQGSALFCAAREEHFSHYTVEIVAANGRLRYEQGGVISWQGVSAHPHLPENCCLQTVSQHIANDMNHYQSRMADQLARAIKGDTHSLCQGEEAVRTHYWLETLFKDRKVSVDEHG
jgi:predicted dehydrogenase